MDPVPAVGCGGVSMIAWECIAATSRTIFIFKFEYFEYSSAERKATHLQQKYKKKKRTNQGVLMVQKVQSC